MNYNPYFPGGAISMARVLFDGLVEYDDGKSCAHPPPSTLTYIYRNTCNYFTDGKRRGHFFKLGS
jgi:Cytochrome C1 family